MDFLVSLEGYDSELRHYLEQHRWPVIMEALLTGVTVMLPYDPWEFISEKLEYLQSDEGRVSILQWDMFVDEKMKPQLSLFRRGMLESLLDESDQPTEEMFTAAFTFRKTKLLNWCFGAWQEFHKAEQEEHAVYVAKLRQSKVYYTISTKRKLFTKWRAYSTWRNTRLEAAEAKLAYMYEEYTKKRLLRAWVEDYKEARRAKKYFERKEEGGEGGSEDVFYWPEGEDPISSLPTDVALLLFGKLEVQGLCRCACVCRSWKNLTESPQLWNKVDFHPIAHFARDETLMRLLHKYRPLLGHLNLRSCVMLTADSLKTIGQCQNLQDLNLSECRGLSDDAMENIAKGCPGLLYLNLSYCYVTDSILRILTKRCVSLHYLSLAYCTGFTSKGLRAISTGKGCRRVVHFDLSGCTQLSADGFYYIGKGCPILNTLLIDDLSNISDHMILKLVENCRTLRHISLLGGNLLSDRAFAYLAMENRKLRSVKIENNTKLTDVTLRALGKACRDLQHLYLAGCSRITDQGLKALGSLRKLQVLNIADCSRVSDAGIRFVVENAPGAQLREVNFTNCIKISDVTLLRMSQSCKSLGYVCFCYCEHISDTGVELLGHIPSLTSLDLTGCNITDQGVAGLRNNPQFRHLTLAELVDITDDGLQKMCSTLSKLETLDLSDCESVTNTGLQTVAFNCRLLRSFYITNCSKVTDDGARFITQACHYLQHLDMSACGITDRALRHFRRAANSLQSLDVLCCVNVTREAVQKLQSRGVEVNYNTDRPAKYHSFSELPVETLIDRI